MKNENQSNDTAAMSGVDSSDLLVSFAEVPLGHRIKYNGSDRIYTVLQKYREHSDDEPMSGVIAEYIPGLEKRLGNLFSHIGGAADCPDEVILLD